MSLVSRMLIKEMALPFLFSFLGLSLFLLLGRLLPFLERLLRAGITWQEFFTFIVLLLPTFWVLVLPMATLLGVLLGFLRLSRDSEMLALLASGVGPGRLLRPVIAVSAAAWLVSLYFTVSLLPHAKHASRSFVRNLTERSLARGIPEKTFISPVPGLTLYVHESHDGGHRFDGVYIRDARRRRMKSQILARSGELAAQAGGSQVALRLHDGMLNRIGRDYANSDVLEFKTYAIRLNLGVADAKVDEGEMSLGTLLSKIDDPSTTPERKLSFIKQVHKRMARPAGALILGLMAAPLGVFFGRTGLSGGVALGITFFLTYYIAMALAGNLAEVGILPPVAAIWMPNALFAIIAGFLLMLLVRRGPIKG